MFDCERGSYNCVCITFLDHYFYCKLCSNLLSKSSDTNLGVKSWYYCGFLWRALTIPNGPNRWLVFFRMWFSVNCKKYAYIIINC